MRIKGFEFNLRELAGSMGDMGTLLPLAVGYFAVNGMNPAGLLVMMGLANIVTGIAYRLPMPIEPMKALAAVAIAQRWQPSLIYATGFGTGMVWLVLSFTGLVSRLAAITPRSLVRGIQVALGIMLAIEGVKLISTGWLLGIGAVAIVLILRDNPRAPAAIVVMALGIVIMAFRGHLSGLAGAGFTLPPITTFAPVEIWHGMVLAGFAQLALTAGNAVIATSALITDYFPDRKVSEQSLAVNHAAMNLASPFFGGMPMCHGSGGLAGQYYFGARTGGTNILEGLIEIGLGLFLAASIASLFGLFPKEILGAMMVLVGVQLTRFMFRIKREEAPMMALTAGIAVATNMAIGFVAALAVYHAVRRWGMDKKYLAWIAG